MLNPTQYAKDVLSGEVVVGNYIINAIKRNEADLKRKDIFFDSDEGVKALQFISALQHTKGKWKGDRFIPMPWQQWLIYTLFGWKRRNDAGDVIRRFRTAYFEVARKGGKTALMSAAANYMFYADGEAGPEVYFGATTTKQAKICFNESRAMVLQNKILKSKTKVYTHNMSLLNDPVSKFEPTSREADNMDGLNPSCAIIDEYHAHKTSDVYDVFKSGMGSRQQPLQLTITTAGFNKGAPCYQLRRTCIDILNGVKKDDSMFTMIFAPDEGDDWTLEDTWKKANPSLGETISIDYLRAEFTQAQNNVSEQVNFKTKHLNLWSETSSTWIETSKWDSAEMKITDKELREMDCYGGLDLASTRDLTAFVLVFADGERIFIKPFFFVPLDTIQARSKADGVAYNTWEIEGSLIGTPGNVVDYEYIRQKINELGEIYKIKSIAYDRWNSSQLIIWLNDDGAVMNPYAQSYSQLSTPTKEIEKKLYNGDLRHDGNPVMSWNISNVEITMDSGGNIKADKSKSEEKIDGVVALAMGIGQMLTERMGDEGDSIYETRDIIML